MLFAAAGTDGKSGAVLLTHFDDDDSAAAREVRVSFAGLGEGKKKLEYYLLDEDHDMALVREEIFTADEFASYLSLPLYTSYLLKVTPV